MLGLSPKNHFMTSRQIETSSEISRCIPGLPTTLSDLVSQMAVPNFTLATEKLEIAEDGAVVQSERNLQIVATIEVALCSTSKECNPTVKAQIFYNAAKADQVGGGSRSYLAQIISGMHHRGQKVNLDEVELDDLDLRKIGPLELVGMSAQKAIFRNLYLWNLNMHGADLTDTGFVKSSLGYVNLSYADITGATFRDVEFRFSEASGLTGNQSDILKRGQRYPDLVTSDITPYYVEKIYLDGSDVDAIADTNPFTLGPRKKLTLMGN